MLTPPTHHLIPGLCDQPRGSVHGPVEGGCCRRLAHAPDNKGPTITHWFCEILVFLPSPVCWLPYQNLLLTLNLPSVLVCLLELSLKLHYLQLHLSQPPLHEIYLYYSNLMTENTTSIWLYSRYICCRAEHTTISKIYWESALVTVRMSGSDKCIMSIMKIIGSLLR